MSIQTNSSIIDVFLTRNNFLRSTSTRISCDFINDRFVLTDNKKTIVRVKEDIKLYELKNVLEEPVFIEKLNISTLNYWHNDLIINGYETLQDYKETSSNDDLDGKFYSLPND